MGRTVNPGNEGFCEILQKRYVDKTGLIGVFGSTIGTPDKLVLSTRPRGFGKSYAALALVAFCSCGRDSRALFEGLEVSGRAGWDANLNAYNVVHLDMAEVIDESKYAAKRHAGAQAAWQSLVVPIATEWVMGGLREIRPDAGLRSPGADVVLTNAMLDVAEFTERRFIFVIDEWDSPYRLAGKDDAAQEDYASWLRSLFNGGTFTPRGIAGA